MGWNSRTKSRPLSNARAFSLAELFLLITLIAVLLGLMAQPLVGIPVALHAAAALTVTLWYRDKWLQMGLPLSPLELVGSFAWSLIAALLVSAVYLLTIVASMGWLSVPFHREPLVMLLGAVPATAATVWVIGQFIITVWKWPRQQWALERRVPSLHERALGFLRCLILMTCAVVGANLLVAGTVGLYSLVNDPRQTADAYVLALVVRCVMFYGGGWLGYCVARRNLRESAATAA